MVEENFHFATKFGVSRGLPGVECEAGLVLSVTRILRATLARFRVYVCMYVCM